MIVQCCRCHRVLIEPDEKPVQFDRAAGGHWLRPRLKEPLIPSLVTATVCPACEEGSTEKLDKEARDWLSQRGERLQAAAEGVVRGEGKNK